jgi:hypothetical protein
MAYNTQVKETIERQSLPGKFMSCPACTSGNQREFAAEINIHHSGLENVSRQSVLAFSKLMVCLDCGSSRFITPKRELALLATGIGPK